MNRPGVTKFLQTIVTPRTIIPGGFRYMHKEKVNRGLCGAGNYATLRNSTEEGSGTEFDCGARAVELCSRVRPVAMQPGRSGTCGLKPVDVGAIRMAYFGHIIPRKFPA